MFSNVTLYMIFLYRDISWQRFDLKKSRSSVCVCHIIAISRVIIVDVAFGCSFVCRWPLGPASQFASNLDGKPADEGVSG